MIENDKRARSEASLTKMKGQIQDISELLKTSLFMIKKAIVKDFDENEKIVTVEIDEEAFRNLEIKAPLVFNYVNQKFEKGQVVTLIQSVTDPLKKNATNFFDKGNWAVLSAHDPKETEIVIPKITLKVKELVIELEEGGKISLGGSTGIEISSSGVKIGGKDFATHSHLAGTLAAPNGPVTGNTGGVL